MNIVSSHFYIDTRSETLPLAISLHMTFAASWRSDKMTNRRKSTSSWVHPPPESNIRAISSIWTLDGKFGYYYTVSMKFGKFPPDVLFKSSTIHY